MDAATDPPRIVFDGGSACAEPSKVESVLRDALSASRPPVAGWSLMMHVEAEHGGNLRAVGDIVEEHGIVIAHRDLRSTRRDCEGLAHAVGVWAALVLDQRAPRSGATGADSAGIDEPAGAAASPASPAGPATEASARGAAGEESGATIGGAPPRSTASPRPPPSLAPESTALGDDLNDPDAIHPRSRAHSRIEVGLGTFVMNGLGGAAVLGTSPFAAFEPVSGMFIRPSLVLGDATTLVPGSASAFVGAVRLDICAEFAGNYPQNRGLEFAPCGGIDAGLTSFPPGHPLGYPDRTRVLPEVAIGPSLNLRGDLGANWSLVLRVVAGVMLTHSYLASVETDRLSGRLELAFAWRTR